MKKLQTTRCMIWGMIVLSTSLMLGSCENQEQASVSVASVALNKKTLSLEVGGSETLIATISPYNATNKNIAWTSDKPDVVSVDENGRVLAVKTGSATITVTTADGGKTAICVVGQLVDGQFIEDFNRPVSDYFDFNQKAGTGGVMSPSEQGTTIISLKIDSDVLVGPGKGPEIFSKDHTHFGTYSARIKTPDATTIQPKAGAVVGYFTYNQEDAARLSEIDFEWLIADPKIIYMGTWTGPVSNPHRIGRIINLATGQIYETIYRKGGESSKPLTGTQNLPASIAPINNYNAASQFYVYGFDWHSDRIIWWIMHPDTNEKIVLWDYSGTTPSGFTGIPPNRSRYLFNFWHTDNWPVHTVPNSTERPMHSFEVEVDWMSYTPF